MEKGELRQISGWTDFISSIYITGNMIDSLGNIMFLCLFLVLIFSPIFILLHLLMPKRFLQKYWTPPYFQTWELGFLESLAFGLQRTNMLCAIIGWPRLGKKRKMTQAYRDVPRWYRWLIWSWYSVFFGSGFTFIFLLAILSAYTAVFE